jgi:hypothetical protein
MAKRYLAVHNIDLPRDEKRGSTTVQVTQRHKADSAIHASDLTKEEIEELLGRGSIRPATADEEEAAEERVRLATERQREGEFDVQRSELSRTQAGERAKIVEKHEAAKQAELTKLEEGHAKERAALEKTLTAK